MKKIATKPTKKEAKKVSKIPPSVTKTSSSKFEETLFIKYATNIDGIINPEGLARLCSDLNLDMNSDVFLISQKYGNIG